MKHYIKPTMRTPLDPPLESNTSDPLLGSNSTQQHFDPP